MTLSNHREALHRKLGEVQAPVTEQQVDLLLGYLALLTRWNARMNLTALRSADEAVERLIVEPVVASFAVQPQATSLVDVGSGGGSPAIPLKIMRPELTLEMVEVKAKKAVFLREVVRTLGLHTARVHLGTFEHVLSDPIERDVLSVRAVRVASPELAMFAKAVRPGGQLLWFLNHSRVVPLDASEWRVERNVQLGPAGSSELVVLRRAGRGFHVEQ